MRGRLCGEGLLSVASVEAAAQMVAPLPRVLLLLLLLLLLGVWRLLWPCVAATLGRGGGDMIVEVNGSGEASMW